MCLYFNCCSLVLSVCQLCVFSCCFTCWVFSVVQLLLVLFCSDVFKHKLFLSYVYADFSLPMFGKRLEFGVIVFALFCVFEWFKRTSKIQISKAERKRFLLVARNKIKWTLRDSKNNDYFIGVV